MCKSGYKNDKSASAKDSSSARTSISSDTSIINNKEVNNFSVKGVLYQKTKLHIFSNPAQSDTFTIQVKGKDYLSAEVHISIHNTAGKELYHEKVPIDFFMESEDYDSLSIVEKETKIKHRVDEMLLENNFEKPAAGLAGNDPEITNDEAYKEFINDKKAVGFIMRLGYEDVIHIAWSKKQGKVVVYFG